MLICALLRLVFTSDGVGFGVVVGVIRELTNKGGKFLKKLW